MSGETSKERKPFAHAWQTSYTGDEWHFAKEVSFSSADIERGMVKNVTPLFVVPHPSTTTSQ